MTADVGQPDQIRNGTILVKMDMYGRIGKMTNTVNMVVMGMGDDHVGNGFRYTP